MNNYILKKFVKNYKDTENPDVRTAYGKTATIFGLICNVILFSAKLIISILTSSVSIGADAINNLSDASTNIIGLAGFKLSQKPADEKHPYGHGRYEYIAALCVAVFMMVFGFELLKSGVERILNPKNFHLSVSLLIVLIISVLIKLWMMVFSKKCAKLIHSKILHATAQDSLNDCITTLSIVAGLIISNYTGKDLDGWIGTGVSLFIMFSAFKLIKSTLDPLIGSMPDMEYVIKIKDKILSYPKVLGIHDLIVHDYGPTRKFASVHVEMPGEDDVFENHQIIDEIENYFLKNEGLNIIIHYDPIVTNDPLYDKLKHKVEKSILEINQLLSIHDFRVINKDSKIKLIFDCVLPHEIDMDKEELERIIIKKIHKINRDYECEISVDEYYPQCLNHSKKNND